MSIPTHQPRVLRGGAVGLADGRLVEAGLVDRVAELRPPTPSAQGLAECDAIPVRHDVVQDGVDGAVDEVGRRLASLSVFEGIQRQLKLRFEVNGSWRAACRRFPGDRK